MSEFISSTGGRSLRRHAFHVLVIAIALMITGRAFGAVPGPTPVRDGLINHTEPNEQLCQPGRLRHGAATAQPRRTVI